MKLLRFGDAGKEKPGALDNLGRIRDLSNYIEDISSDTVSEADNVLLSLNLLTLPLVEKFVRYGPCIGKVGKIICVGLNYQDHIKETNSSTPLEPIIFGKLCAPTGANDDILLPRYSTHTDWEVELGVVIGKESEHIKECDSQNHIAGYCLINDLSERKFQLECGGQWVKGKSCRGFAPIGPWLVTKDEISNVQNLNMWLEVNGVRYQNSNTTDMLFGVNYLISYISKFMVLMPGDIVSTGTPSGVGMGLTPKPKYLHDGDTIKLGIDQLGVQEQRVYNHTGEHIR